MSRFARGASPLVLSFAVIAAVLPPRVARADLTGAERPSGTDAVGAASEVGEWSAPFDLGTIAIHSALLPTGQILVFERPDGGAHGSAARVWDPGTGILQDTSLNDDRDLFCSGHSLLADGRVLITGGHVHGTKQVDGVADTTLFDPITSTWTPGPTMSEARWYPTNVTLADGRVLIFGGHHKRNELAQSVELYDPGSNTLSTLPGTASRKVGVYPRMVLLPDGRVFQAGPGRRTYLFDPANATWSTPQLMLARDRQHGTALLLPGLQKVLAFGGVAGHVDQSSGEIIDLSEEHPRWRPTASLAYARSNATSVILPDGTVLAVGGGTGADYGSPVETPEVFDPATEMWSSLAPMSTDPDHPVPRMYHSSALLLPDGRILAAGQDKQNPYATTGQIFSPPYLFRGPRPTISDVPASAVYGEALTISSPDADSIARVALVRPGSVTHAFAFDQRYVDLPIASQGEGMLTVTAPPDGNHAPPGWYMLFAIDDAGVPSVASWVHIDATMGPRQVQEPPPARNVVGETYGSSTAWTVPALSFAPLEGGVDVVPPGGTGSIRVGAGTTAWLCRLTGWPSARPGEHRLVPAPGARDG